MGREIRKVPPNWQHPTEIDERGKERKRAMHDQTYADAVRKWKEGYAAWERGERPKYATHSDEYWEYAGAPPSEPEMYRPWKDEEATWFQLWQTVSEGSPVSPPFPTLEELADYLAENGDEWDQSGCREPFARELGYEYGKSGWGKERAYAFIRSGWAPSAMVNDGKMYSSSEIPLVLERTE